MKIMVAALVLAAWAVPAVSQAQSLAEIAEKTKKKKSGAAKVITEDDLRKSGGKANFVGEEGSAATAEPAEGEKKGDAEKKEKSPEEVRAEDQTKLQKKMDEQKKLKDVVRKAMDDAQLELNDIGNYSLGTRRQSLMKLIEDGEKELAKIDQEMADIEEQARRLGVSVSR